jgi:hypothetical protein
MTDDDLKARIDKLEITVMVYRSALRGTIEYLETIKEPNLAEGLRILIRAIEKRFGTPLQ